MIDESKHRYQVHPVGPGWRVVDSKNQRIMGLRASKARAQVFADILNDTLPENHRALDVAATRFLADALR